MVLAGCDSSPLGQSCGGSEVMLCGPHEWAEITEASLTPERLTIADFGARAQIHVVLERCDEAPAPHEVEISVLVGGDGMDGGPPVGVTGLLTVADGEGGDPVAGDGIIDVEVVNPLIATLPPDTTVTLRYVARSSRPAGCTSGVFEQSYQTGPARP